MFSKALASVNDDLRLCISLFLVSLLCTCASAQKANEILSGTALKEQIESQRSTIELATIHHLSNAKLGYLWAVLASMYRHADDFTAAEGAYIKALDLQRDIPSAAQNYATTLDNLGSLYLLYGRFEEAEHYNRMGAKIRERMGYKLDLARSEEHLAEIDLARHRVRQADSEAESALRTIRAENDPEAIDEIAALNVLAFTRCLRNRCADGLALAKESVKISRLRMEEHSLAMAHSMMALGFASWKSGRLEEAEPQMRSAIEMMQAQSLPAGQGLMLALLQYRNYLRETRRMAEADTVDKELNTVEEQMSGACPDCINVRSLALKAR